MGRRPAPGKISGACDYKAGQPDSNRQPQALMCEARAILRPTWKPALPRHAVSSIGALVGGSPRQTTVLVAEYVPVDARRLEPGKRRRDASGQKTESGRQEAEGRFEGPDPRQSFLIGCSTGHRAFNYLPAPASVGYGDDGAAPEICRPDLPRGGDTGLFHATMDKLAATPLRPVEKGITPSPGKQACYWRTISFQETGMNPRWGPRFKRASS